MPSNSPAPRFSSPLSRWASGLTLFAAVVVLAWIAGSFPIKNDDAYITFRVARRLADGNGLVYNRGQRMQVSTTPVYCLLLAATRRAAGCDVTTASRFWEFLFLTANVFLLWWMVVRLGFGDWAWLAPLLVVADPAIVALATGMESALFMAFILATLWMLGSDRPVWAAGFLAGAVLTRLDGLILALLVGVVRLSRLVRGTESPRQWTAASATQLAVFAAMVLPWFLFARLYFGNPLPVTIAHKMSQTREMDLPAFGSFFLRNFVWDARDVLPRAMLIPFLFGAAALLKKRDTTFWFVEWWALYLLVYIVAHMPAYLWYQFPLYVPAVAISAIGLATIVRWTVAQEPVSLRSILGVLLLSFVLSCFVCQTWKPWRFLAITATTPDDSPLRDNKRYGAVGRYLAGNSPPNAVVAAFEVGLVGYYSERQILDLTGLTSPLSEDERRQPTIELVLSRRPDYLVVEQDIYRSWPEVLRRRFEQAYRSEKTFVDPYLGETVVVFKKSEP